MALASDAKTPAALPGEDAAERGVGGGWEGVGGWDEGELESGGRSRCGECMDRRRLCRYRRCG